MDKCEEWAREYLIFKGFQNILYEPDGNVPPDFLVDGRIAVEVRRLNQHHENDAGEVEALERLAIPLRIKLQKLLASFGPPGHGASWYVYYKFKRPQLTKNWEEVLRDHLKPFHAAIVQKPKAVINIDDNFSVTLLKKQAPSQESFILAGNSDYNSGGWVIPELENNLRICVEEKTAKIAKCRHKYPIWWLLLIDFIVGGAEEPVRVSHDWDKLIVVHPGNFAGAYELANSGSNE